MTVCGFEQGVREHNFEALERVDSARAAYSTEGERKKEKEKKKTESEDDQDGRRRPSLTRADLRHTRCSEPLIPLRCPSRHKKSHQVLALAFHQ